MVKEEEIRLIAYEIWEQEGCINGKDCEHWSRAEAIWEEQQKPEATEAKTKTQPKQVARKTKKDKAPKQKKT
jgi:hypothetical protein